MKGLNEQYASSLLELSIFTIYLMKGLPASQFKVKVNIFVIVLILQLRSATVVIAYLMMKQNMTCKQVHIIHKICCFDKSKHKKQERTFA